MASTQFKNKGASTWYVEVRTRRGTPSRKPAFAAHPTHGDHQLPGGDSRNPGLRDLNAAALKPGAILFLRAESTDASPFSFHPGDLPIERMWVNRVNDKWEVTILLKEEEEPDGDLPIIGHDPEVKHPDPEA